MTTVGFIGLGIMGGPMAANLVKAGFDVTGYNRSPEPVQRLAEQGGRGAHTLADARPVLEAVGRTVVHVGPAGSGQTVKAANQLIVAGTIELVAEAIVFLEAYGVDLQAAVKVLAGGLAGNAILDRKAAGMLRRDFTPGFRIELHHKDMGIVTSAAREAGVVIPLGALVAQLVASLKAQGDGGLDHSALLKLVEQLSGRR